MKKLVSFALGATTMLTTIIAGAAPASATPENAYVGGCVWHAPTELGSTAILEAYVIAYSPTPTDEPAQLDHVECQAYVNGSHRATVPVAAIGPVAVLGPTPISIDHDVNDILTVCTVVVYVNSTPDTACVDQSGPLVPAPVLDTIGSLSGIAASTICPVLVGFAPIQVQNHVKLEADGDLTIAGTKIYDCPSTP